jgi:hypothetical protein
LDRPEQDWEIRKGRHIFQARIPMGRPEKVYLVRVVVETDRQPPEVVTAYRTSKIDKYWRKD